MAVDYSEAVDRAASIVFEAMSADRHELYDTAGAALWEVSVRDVVRSFAKKLAQRTVDAVGIQLVKYATDRGLRIERSPVVAFMSIFGGLTVKSPYMVHPTTGVTDRPVNRELEIHGGGCSMLAQRALTDFGVEASFEKAKRRFQEHYGIELDRTAILRLVERQGARAIEYIGERLEAAMLMAEVEPPPKPVEVMVVEMDGSEARTGKLVPIPGTTATTPVRKLPKRQRVTAWRDVRVGLVRPLDSDDASYVASLSPFDVVVASLAALGVERGAGADTTWVKVIDGGNGLREALDREFSGPTILDKGHCRAHLFDTAKAIGIPEQGLAAHVGHWTSVLSAGGSPEVIEELEAWRPAGWTAADEAAHRARPADAPIKLDHPAMDRVRRLATHLLRFADAVGYDAFRDQGLPIGSGEVESAQRFIPQARLKLPGAWWLPENIDRILALRVIRENGWWDDFWGMNADPIEKAA